MPEWNGVCSCFLYVVVVWVGAAAPQSLNSNTCWPFNHRCASLVSFNYTAHVIQTVTTQNNRTQCLFLHTSWMQNQDAAGSLGSLRASNTPPPPSPAFFWLSILSPCLHHKAFKSVDKRSFIGSPVHIMGAFILVLVLVLVLFIAPMHRWPYNNYCITKGMC